MSIAFFNYLMLEYGGGFAGYLQDIARGLRDRHPDLSVTLVTFDEAVVARIQRVYSWYFGADVRTPPVIAAADLAKRLGPVAYVKARSVADLGRILRSHDLVYSKNDIVEASILRYLVGPCNLPPVVFGFHTPVRYEITATLQNRFHNLMYDSLWYRHALSPARAFHVLNEFDKRWLGNRFPGMRIEVIHNPFDSESFRRAAGKKMQRNGPLRILWVGRLTIEKGIEDLAEIIERVNHETDLVSWRIVGDGDKRDLVESLCRRFGNIRYDPHIDHSDMPSVYAQSDLFVMNSKCECYPYVLLEAAACGVPALSYRIHGCDEIIIPGKTGAMVNSTGAMAEAIVSYSRSLPFSSSDISRHICDNGEYERAYEQLYALLTHG